jgi:molecular chaperone DnaK (HSP70)
MNRYISILLSFLFLFLFNISFALTEKDFKHSMNFYQKLVGKKVRVEELILTLEKIINKYKDIGVNLTPVKEKLLVLKAFKTSRDFYKKVEERKASLDERIAAVKRILNKFKNIDMDLSDNGKET